MIASILDLYGIRYEDSIAETIATGLINRTWKITAGEAQFILQRINENVFKKPYEVAENISMLNEYLTERSPGYLFVAPVKNVRNEEITFDNEHGYFRMFPFVQGSHTINVVSTPDQAFEASLQFGRFAKLVSEFDASRLHLTIPDFHNLSLRYQQFLDAIKFGNPDRIKQSAELISEIKKYSYILSAYEKIKKSAKVYDRVTHNDTKISNVLFDDHGKGMCIIDLDTIMPGYFISDVGDMMRTYLSPANEEEKDFTKIVVRDDFFRAIVQGYLTNMSDELSAEERKLILYAGLFLIYMQAIRFLADYCVNDTYYGARYEEQNFVRAGNQLCLLKNLEEKSRFFEKMISNELKTKSYLIHS
ncbi:MAG: aminoglycoside phosphotransferase family protein [Bacteroidia bacterium]|nr:aminoglycoside phosphotransferase family protein [Bacteroidia bacterium]